MTNCVRIFPATAIQFSSFEYYKKLIPLHADRKDLTPLQRLGAGAMAGITGIFFFLIVLKGFVI
jgi:solute carrier family 25 phosphate transporter 23/24/25/41